MARPVPIGDYEEQVPVQEGLRRVIPEMRPGTVGEAISNLGGAVEKVAQSQAAGYVGSAMAKLRLAAEQHLIDAGNKSQDDLAKAGGFTPSVMGDYQKSADAALEGAPNSLAKRLMQHGIAQVGQELTGRAMHIEAVARVAQSKNDAQTAIEHAASAVELNPDSWRDAGAEQIHSIRTLNVDPITATELQRDANQKIGLAAGRGYAKADPLGTLKRLDDPNDELLGGLTTEARAHVQQYARAQFVDQKAAGIVDQYGNQGVRAGVASLASMEKDQSIPVDLKDAVRDQVNRQVDQLRDQRREQHAGELASLESRIATGDAGGPKDRAHAWALYDSGALSPTQFASTMAGIARSEQSGVDDNADLEAARAAYQNGAALDPEHNKKGVAKLFAELTQATTPGSQEYVNRAVDITARVGVAPEPAVSWARTQLVGGDPKSAAAAADLVSKLDNANSRALPFAEDGRTKALAGVISSAVSSGTDPQVAVELARRAQALPKDDLEALDERWRKAKLGEQQPHALRTLMQTANPEFKGGWFTSAPQIPTQMQGDFDQLTRQYYHDTGGDVALSRQLAARDVGHVWGVSRVNGGAEVMAYPPEHMFPGLTAETIREDIDTTAKGSPDLKGVDAKKIRLVEDPLRTARTGGAQWNLAAPDKNGLVQVLRGEDGNPLVYQLPITKNDYEAVRTNARNAALEQLRVEQARHKDLQPFGEAVPGL